MVNSIKPISLNPENESRFQSFILFEPASSRVGEFDILFRGEKVIEMYEIVMAELAMDDSLKTQIIKNRLSKIGQMISLLTVYDNIVLSKFFDRIWRRYSYVSNIGEPFLDYKTFSRFFPEYTDLSQLVAQRLDDEDDEDPESGVDPESDPRVVDSEDDNGEPQDIVPLDDLVAAEESQS